MTHPAPRWIAAALVAVCLLSWFVLSDRSQQAFALDDMIETIMTAKSARFRTTARMGDQPALTAKALFLEPSRIRQEMENGYINIADWKAGKMVGLDPKSKRATVINLLNMPEDQRPGNQFEQLRDQLRKAQIDPDKNVERLGQKEIEGRPAVGFRFKTKLQPMTIWADPKTHLPLQIKMVFLGPPRIEVTMTDFEFNVELDEALFSVEPPEGYKVVSMDMDASLPTEADLIASLRLYSDLADGEFPDKLHLFIAPSLMTKLGFDKDKQPDEDRMKELMQQITRIGRGVQFALLLEEESDAHYAGAGAKRGDAERAIFWYKPEKSNTYRVVFADLTVRDSATAPEVPNAQRLSTPDAKGPNTSQED